MSVYLTATTELELDSAVGRTRQLMLEGKQLFRKGGGKRKDTKDEICRNCRSSGRGRTIEDRMTLMLQGKSAKGDNVTIASVRRPGGWKGEGMRL